MPVNAGMSLEICRDSQLHGRHPCVDWPCFDTRNLTQGPQNQLF